jgi:hypothetical protein
MTRDLLSYWKPKTASNNAQDGDGLLEHSASNQYGRLEIGDTVWLVTVREGDLYLLGRITVSRLLPREEALRAFPGEDLWDAKYHICSEPGKAQPIKEIHLGHLTGKLRFQSLIGKDRLVLTNGKVNPQQLQTMRILKSGVAPLLEAALGGECKATKQKAVPGKTTSKAALKTPPRLDAPVGKVKSTTTNPKDILTALRQLQVAARENYGKLIKPGYEEVDRSEVDLNGLCYVLSECMYHLFPTFTSYRIPWADGSSHWFLRYPDGQIFDPIYENGECDDPVEYEGARRRGFLTSWPSKRALLLFTLAGIAYPSVQS